MAIKQQNKARAGEIKTRTKEIERQVVALLNERIDLELEMLKLGDFREAEETHGRGKNKKTFKVGRVYWKEGFKDESTGKKIFIERSNAVTIDGKFVDRFGNEIKRFTVDGFSPVR